MTNSLETGGSERQFVTLAQALDRKEFSVSLGCLDRRGAFLEGLNGIAEFSPGGNLYKWSSQRARIRLARQLRHQRIAVAQSFGFYPNLMLIPAARLARVPVVIGSHRQLGDLLTPMRSHVQNMMFRLCDRVVCNSRAAAERLRKTVIPDGRLAVIPNGIPEEFFAPVSPAVPRNTESINVGMISRMNHPAKRHDLFLRAAAQLAPRFPRLRFILAGDGPLRPEFQQLAQSLGLSGRVVFLGDRRDVPAVLAALDISVLPSSSESLSNVILESMAAGVAVVATAVGGNPELLEHGETGLLVPDGDEDGLVAALEQLVTRPELRAQCASRGREKANREYSVGSLRDRYQELYRGLLLEKGWKPAES